jgi:hypothetical protein
MSFATISHPWNPKGGEERRLVGGTRIAWFGLVIIMVLFVSACVQPIEPTPGGSVATPFVASPTPPAPPPQGPNFPPDVISQWIGANLGTTASGLTLFYQVPVGPNDLVGYTFQDASGLTCVGFAQTTAATFQVWNADYRCYTTETQAIAAPLLFALTNNEFYAAGFGYVNTTLVSGASGVTMIFPDGNNVTTPIFGNGGFVMLRPGLELPTQAVVVDGSGTPLITVDVQ